MEANTPRFYLSFLSLLLSSRFLVEGFNGEEEEKDIKRTDFPLGFVFGKVTSAYQIEGAYIEDGKSLNNWDVFSRIQGNIKHGDNGYSSVDDYHRYLNFGDRVKYWMTINEPNLFAKLAYVDGMYPPGRCSLPFGNCSVGNSDIEPLTAMHNMLLAHAKAAKLYRDHFQAIRLVKGNIHDNTGMPECYVVPRGMENVVDYLNKRYHNMPMFVTENGYASLELQDAQMKILLLDSKRIEFHKAYLAFLARAIRKGADVRGGFHGEEEDKEIQKSDFPHGFLFGISTSAYQTPYTYQRLHRLKELILKMVKASATGMLILISQIIWASDSGIEPFVTIHHNDLPQELEDKYQAWLSPLIQEDFVHFAKICFENFGDRVKYWITINEPNTYADLGYIQGKYPPARCSKPFGNCYAGNSDVEPLIAMHNMLLAHAKAVKLYREQFQAISRPLK
ncbi:hypothetical protein RJ639_031808 [Escallonia herrerae]|uniref:Uncharacterized protein n=1 Tax=Escallonia herrerae TaxID=1293975 RepID=A0AA88X118_9ASTE|nr:hypothetical protein RJ639_031808 [Escallonia herrerae]